MAEHVHEHMAVAEGASYFSRLFEVFTPRIQCMNYEPDVIWLHLVSDLLIAAAYFSIPVALVYFVGKRKDLAFNWMFLLFALFIILCGTTHLFGVWALWHPLYRLDGVVKFATGIVSIATAALLWRLVPEALALPSPAQLREANGKLALEVTDRQRAEGEAHRLAAELDRRVQERTEELAAANAALQQAHADLERRVDERTQELHTAHGFLHAVLENISDGVVACDPDGALTVFNRATREFHGLPPEPLPPERWAERYDLYRPDGITPLPTDEVPLFRALRGEEVRDVEMVIAPKNGPVRTLVASGQALVEPDGRRLGAVVSMHDLTERKRAEEELRAYARRLRRSNEELEQFASVASHDLQEPLRKIQAFGDRLQAKFSEALGEQGQDYIARMQSSALRMRALIDALLTFSRVTTQAQPFLVVDLGVVARDVLSDLETRMRESGGRVDLGALPTIDADPFQMRQLLQNLIANALKFHKPGEPPTVTVDAVVSANRRGVPQCEVSVRDDGIGFEEEYLDRIFEVFQRLHGRQKYEGTGVGLAICRKIAERHGGSITARSEPGSGATFVVTLPMIQINTETKR